jgi:hypothetical membrane protein
MGPAIVVLSSWFFAAQVLVAWVFRPQYSFVSNVISDLGNTACPPPHSNICSPRWFVWDATVFFLGVALLVGSLLIFTEFSFSKHRRERAAALAGFVCLALGGLGAILVGFVPENLNWFHLHTVGTAAAIGFGQLGILILGLVLRQIPDWLREFMIVTSLIVLLAGISIAFKHQFGTGAGGSERLAQYPESVWLILFGFYISRDHYRNNVIGRPRDQRTEGRYRNKVIGGFKFSEEHAAKSRRKFRPAFGESRRSVRRPASRRGSWASFQPPKSAGSFTPELMLLLTDGSVLIHDAGDGTGTSNWIRLTPDSSGSYPTGRWSSLLPMSNTRQYFSSAVLRDGRVYVMGGEYSNAGDGSGDTPLGEIFDPQINTWCPMQKPTAFGWIQGDAPAAVLPDGRVLFGNLDSPSPPFSTAIWDPVTGDWTVAGSGAGTLATDTRQNSSCTEETWTLLPDGSVLTANVYGEPRTERYVPSIDEWVSAGTPPVILVITRITDPTGVNINVSEIGPAILLPDGRVFAIGGTGQTALYTPPPAGSDPKTNPGTWAAGPPFPDDTSKGAVWPTLTAADAPAVLQTNGKVLCVGGSLSEINQGKPNADYMSQNMTLLEFDPETNGLTAFPPVPFGSPGTPWAYTARFLLLPTGQILLTTQDSDTHEIYIYTPDAADNASQDAWRPTIITAPSTLVPGHTYTITGTQFNGLSQAVSYGDDAQMATNYPIVRLSNTAGDVTYLRSFNFSTMAVATGTQPVSTSIEVPGTVTPGIWQMTVIANGIPSQPVNVKVAAVPVITGVFPRAGRAAGGDTVTITGTGFTGATGIGVGPATATAMTVDSNTQITATTPPGRGTVDITVTTAAGTSAATPADQFTYAATVTPVTVSGPQGGWWNVHLQPRGGTSE